MRLNLNPWRQTLFLKLVASFLVVITPLYVLGLTMNRLVEASALKELSSSVESRVNYYLASLDVEKEHMNQMLQEIVVDKDVHHLTFISKYMSIFEWSETVTRIQNKLQMIKYSSVYIKSAEVHILTFNRTLSSERSISDSIAEEYLAIKPQYAENYQGFVPWKDRLFLRLAYPQSIKPGSQPSFMVSIELDINTMKKALQKITDYNHSGALLINPSQGWLLSNDTDKAALPYIEQFLKKQYKNQVMKGIQQIDIANNSNLIAYEYSESMGSYLVVYVPYNQVFGQLDSYRSYFWGLSLLAFIVIIAYSYWLYRMIHKPLRKLIRSFRKVEIGQMEHVVLPKSNDEFRYLFQHFNWMIDQLNDYIHQAVEQKIRVQSSELKQLQSQINPHFLYNTYFILHRLAKMQDQETVMAFSRNLGEYFQYITRSAANEVPFEGEIQHARTYATIQNIRFSERIHAEFSELPEACKAILVPKLILQPIIENAYKYGLEYKRKGGILHVEVAFQHRILTVIVEDNGDKLSDEQLEVLKLSLYAIKPDMEYTGILNVHRRLQIRYGEESGIRVERGESGGLRVTLHIIVGDRDLEEAAPTTELLGGDNDV